MAARSAPRDRYSFANLDEVLERLDLFAILRDSFSWFVHHGLAETFRVISPIKDFTELLQLQLEFDHVHATGRPPPKLSVDECKATDMTLSATIFIAARLRIATTAANMHTAAPSSAGGCWTASP